MALQPYRMYVLKLMALMTMMMLIEGRTSSAGAAGAILYSMPELLAETFVNNVKGLARPGGNK